MDRVCEDVGAVSPSRLRHYECVKTVGAFTDLRPVGVIGSDLAVMATQGTCVVSFYKQTLSVP